MSEYIALIHKEPTTGFGASFPDFPGAVTVADTLENLRSEAEAVLAFHIEGMIEDGDAIPEPSTLDAVIGLKDYRDAVAVLVVKAPDVASLSVRINVTIPDMMLKRIDRHAAKQGLSRSGFLVRAAKKQMEVEGT
jgi:predicted RNase H-like HicB family nuclease/predicted DNA binding CopG/RHH family protein